QPRRAGVRPDEGDQDGLRPERSREARVERRVRSRGHPAPGERLHPGDVRPGGQGRAPVGPQWPIHPACTRVQPGSHPDVFALAPRCIRACSRARSSGSALEDCSGSRDAAATFPVNADPTERVLWAAMTSPRLVRAAPEPLPARSDDELMTLAQAGLREAFAVLVERHAERLVQVCARFVNDGELGAELAQETWVALWTERAK